MDEIQRHEMNGKHETLGVYRQDFCELRKIYVTSLRAGGSCHSTHQQPVQSALQVVGFAQKMSGNLSQGHY